MDISGLSVDVSMRSLRSLSRHDESAGEKTGGIEGMAALPPFPPSPHPQKYATSCRVERSGIETSTDKPDVLIINNLFLNEHIL
jgi:hypothetical protein